MKLYKTDKGTVIELDGKYKLGTNISWDEFINYNDVFTRIRADTKSWPVISADTFKTYKILAPIGQQEVWAAGVT